MSKFDAIAVGRRVLTAESEALKLQAKVLGSSFTQAVWNPVAAAAGRGVSAPRRTTVTATSESLRTLSIANARAR